jgi:hypothetical protein
MFMNIIQKPTTKKVITTPEFGDMLVRDRLELICKFLHFADNETINSFEGPKKLFKFFL